MVGLVIVSHSRTLANALVILVKQVAAQQIPVAVAAGVGPERQDFGTDALEISEAIQSVFGSEGVVVLMDLGSAVLSAQMALELLPEDMHAKIHFCSAPLVEGAIAAGVQIGLGSDPRTVCQEARQALLPKEDQIGDGRPIQAASHPEMAEDFREAIVTLSNEHGLHARPAAKFVQQAARFNALIRVKNLTAGKGPVSAKSLNALATLGALNGHQIAILASGPQEKEALDALCHLVEDNFGETYPAPAGVVPPPPVPVSTREGAVQAVPVAEGVALGPLALISVPSPEIPDHPNNDPQAAWNDLLLAVSKVEQQISARGKQFAARAGEQQAGIFEAHLLILQDPELLSNAREKIFNGRLNAAAAWHECVQETIAAYQALEDPYLKQRAADVSDVGNQVLQALAGEVPVKMTFSRPVVLLAEDLTPTQTAMLDLEKVLGLATVLGGTTSHSAILARSLGIPAITGAPNDILQLEENTLIGVDGFNGRMWISPSEAVQAELRALRTSWLDKRQRLFKTSQAPAVTRDKFQIEIAANVGNLPDAQAAVKNGAEAIGLLRTEFLFLTRKTAPDEEEQIAALRQIAEVMGDRPIIIRTLDVGGDKALPYIDLPVEANPFLGVRAIRLSLQRADLFKPQLRSILRAGVGHRLRIMFPMVANVSEVLQAREILKETRQELLSEGVAHVWPIETGIMIEIPSSALMAQKMAPFVDFFSVGTNDLTQYTLAAERGNPNLAGLSDALHPAVLRLIRQVVEAAEAHGKWVGVCGELAGDPEAAPVLAGLGVKELSLNPAGIPHIKAIIRRIYLSDARVLANQVLNSRDAAESRALAGQFLAGLGL